MSLLTASLLFLLAGLPTEAAPCKDLPQTIEVAHEDHVAWPAIDAQSEGQESDEKHVATRSARRADHAVHLQACASRVTLPETATAGSARRAVMGCRAYRGPPARV